VDVDEGEESKLFFDPGRGNVVFASAYDGWAFTVDSFAALHSSKLEVPRTVLRRALWGDFYYKAKVRAAASLWRHWCVAVVRVPPCDCCEWLRSLVPADEDHCDGRCGCSSQRPQAAGRVADAREAVGDVRRRVCQL